MNTSTVESTVINNRTGAVNIRWSDPVSPNGLILTYEIEYSKSNIQNVSSLSLLKPLPIMCCLSIIFANSLAQVRPDILYADNSC